MQTKEHMKMTEATAAEWWSPAEAARYFKVSRAQISRIATAFKWIRLDVSVGKRGKNQGVRYARRSIEEYERSHTY